MALEKVLALDASGLVEKTIVTGAGVDGVVVKHAITLTSGQTTVAVPGGYSAAGVIVFLNGVYLTPAEYTASSSPNIVLAVGAPSTGSILDVLVLVSDGLSMVTSAGYTIMTAADAATQRTALGLGTAAVAYMTASATDTTAGRVLKVGDFGFNGPSIAAGANADLNWAPFAKTIANARFQGYSWVNMPVGLAATAAVVEWQSYSPDWGRQLFVDIAYRKSYERYWYNGTTWSQWAEVATSANSLGQGQTWQTMTGSRALGVTYTNTTGRPIQVAVHVETMTGYAGASITVSGVQVGTVQGQFVTSTNRYDTLTAIVPNGATYSSSITPGSSSTAAAWVELR